MLPRRVLITLVDATTKTSLELDESGAKLVDETLVVGLQGLDVRDGGALGVQVESPIREN